MEQYWPDIGKYSLVFSYPFSEWVRGFVFVRWRYQNNYTWLDILTFSSDNFPLHSTYYRRFFDFALHFLYTPFLSRYYLRSACIHSYLSESHEKIAEFSEFLIITPTEGEDRDTGVSYVGYMCGSGGVLGEMFCLAKDRILVYFISKDDFAWSFLGKISMGVEWYVKTLPCLRGRFRSPAMR